MVHVVSRSGHAALFAALRRKNLVPPAGDVAIGKDRYQVEIDDHGGRVRQRSPDGEKTYPIAHVMGGKNVYYFLTPLERGRLQVLPRGLRRP